MIITLVLMAIAALLILRLAKKGTKSSVSVYESRPNTSVTPPSAPKAAPSTPVFPSPEQGVLRFSGEIRGWLQQIAVLAEACMPNRYSHHNMMIWGMWGENEEVGLISFTLIADEALKDRVAELHINLSDSGMNMKTEELDVGDGKKAHMCTLRTSLEHQVWGIQKFLRIDSVLEQRTKEEGSVDLCSSDNREHLVPICQEMKNRLHDSRDIKITDAKITWEEQVEGYGLKIEFKFE